MPQPNGCEFWRIFGSRTRRRRLPDCEWRDYAQINSIAMLDTAGMQFTENEYVAKFMLKKLTTEALAS